MQVVVNDTDITNYIVNGTYKMEAQDSYESWKDANGVEHRIIITSKVTGSFDLVCSNRSDSITLPDFLALWNGAVDNGVVTVGVYVINQGELKAIDAYYEISSKEHIRSGDGSLIDVLTISISER